MKKIIQRKDLDLKLIFEGLVREDFSKALEQEIKKVADVIKYEEATKIIGNEEEAKTTAFSFLGAELK